MTSNDVNRLMASVVVWGGVRWFAGRATWSQDFSFFSCFALAKGVKTLGFKQSTSLQFFFFFFFSNYPMLYLAEII